MKDGEVQFVVFWYCEVSRTRKAKSCTCRPHRLKVTMVGKWVILAKKSELQL